MYFETTNFETRIYDVNCQKAFIELIDTVEHRFKHYMFFSIFLFCMYILFILCVIKVKGKAAIPTKPHFAQYRNALFKLTANNG